jgi:hypothetical protein
MILNFFLAFFYCVAKNSFRSFFFFENKNHSHHFKNTAFFICIQEPGKSSPTGKTLVKEAPEMLAISQWTGQIPRRPPLPEGCSISQLIALGSRRKRSKVYWMLAQSEQEVR